MKTIVIQIGNSDDKLSQFDWSRFIGTTHELIKECSYQIHFSGFSLSDAPWQNACWVCIVDTNQSRKLKRNIKKVCGEFKQNNIAWTEGTTVFVKP